jgi:hypothetical protein
MSEEVIAALIKTKITAGRRRWPKLISKSRSIAMIGVTYMCNIRMRYDYNKRVNQLSNIGEHYTILKALSNGVSEQDISVSLSVDVETIRRKRSMLDASVRKLSSF